jgi:hypothetical protein
MNRSKDSLLPELSLLMTAHPATLSLLLPNPAFHSPNSAAEDQHGRLSDRAGTARFVTMIRMWIGLAQP